MLRIKFNTTPTDAVGGIYTAPWPLWKNPICWWHGHGPYLGWRSRGLGIIIKGKSYNVSIWTKGEV